MQKRGMLALTSLIQIIIAIIGAVLFAYIAVSLFTLFFPPTTVGISTEGSIDQIVHQVEAWNKLESKQFTFLPFMVNEDRVLVGFDKGVENSYALNQVIKKPRECKKDESCLCVYKSTEDCPEVFNGMKLGNAIKCWKLPGIDRVYAPKTTQTRASNEDQDGYVSKVDVSNSVLTSSTYWGLSRWGYNTILEDIKSIQKDTDQKTIDYYLRKGIFEFPVFQWGAAKGESIKGYPDPPKNQKYAHLVVHGGDCSSSILRWVYVIPDKILIDKPINKVMKSQTIYLEKQTKEDTSILFLTSVYDPVVKERAKPDPQPKKK